MLNKLIPPSREYGHEQTWHDGNGHSHLQATWLGPEITVPVRDRRLVSGTWQQIFHLECDIKPRQRQIMVTVYGKRQGEQGRECRLYGRNFVLLIIQISLHSRVPTSLAFAHLYIFLTKA
ncbi:YjbQ family protein [Fischerella thermalis]|uniref:YjbQ family protein n=1 Tax=Fischerella thermalis TaxID=372787 RepID=UPI002155DCFD|nr:YjbQ family protein [Fischerella thermalis]